MDSHLTSLIKLIAHDTFETLSSSHRTHRTPPSLFSTIRITNISTSRCAQPIDYVTAYQQLHEQLQATGLLYQRKKQTLQPTYAISELTPQQPIKKPVVEGHPLKCRCASCVQERKRRQCRGGASRHSHGKEPDLSDKFYHCDPVEDARQRHRALREEVYEHQEREQRQQVAAQQVALALARKEERRQQDELLYVGLPGRLRAVCKQALPVICVRPTPRVTSTSQGEQGEWQVMSRRGKKGRAKNARES
ncbi:hypothetical protein SI65_03625 [Aspergillus cristatus]|uniref:Uncharacterized protein n=1 Tax=Aspergillus cristatus TaxID=573508 RepID=A0A1E3BHX2_ASPCR|nr:hypothetical protein SI65_03625 [Aspergillus cristatus]